MVEEALSRGVPNFSSLPHELQPVVDRHFENLVALVCSLQAAGRPQITIDTLVNGLLDSYRADLIQALERQA